MLPFLHFGIVQCPNYNFTSEIFATARLHAPLATIHAPVSFKSASRCSFPRIEDGSGDDIRQLFEYGTLTNVVKR